MSAPLPPAVSAALADLEAATGSARPHKWLALARAWTEAAGEAAARASGDGDSNAASAFPDATECHERAYTAYATGLRELLQGQTGAATQAEEEALSSGRMQALAALAAVPPSAPAPLTPAASPSIIKRVYVVSDLHVDQPLPWRCGCLSQSPPPKTGMDWLRGGGIAGDPLGAVVVAGDCADSLTATLSALAELKQRFARVFYCPGNHELYLRGTDAAAFPDSWCKLFALRRACARLGVETEPAAVVAAATPESGGAVVVVIAPLLSWYDDGAFCNGGSASSSSLAGVRYDAPCAWGPVREQDVHRVMLSLAKRELATAARAAAAAAAALSSASSPASSTSASRDVVLVTATHFLPRRELPFHGGLMDRAMGCAVLGEAVLPALAGAVFGNNGGGKSIHIHAYGHSHIHCDRDDVGGDGVRYVQRALGAGPSGGSGEAASAASAASSAASCRCFQPLLVWEAPSS